MTKRIRRRIITETRQVALLLTQSASGDALCELCGARMVSPLPAARILKTGTREIYRAIETGRIHFVELRDGQIFVCPQSMVET
jgi:hypothetical protein